MSSVSKSHRWLVCWRISTLNNTRRQLSSTPRSYLSPLFALGALSNARETQHLSKESRLSRVEHSPNLQLIQSSEVAPFARPKSPAPLQPALESSQTTVAKESKAATKVVPAPKVQYDGLSEADLLSVGRAILVEKNAELFKLRKALEEEKDRSVKREATYALARTNARDRISRLHNEVSSERLWKWTFLVVGLTAAAWVYATETGKVSYSLGEITPVKHDRESSGRPHQLSQEARAMIHASLEASPSLAPSARTQDTPVSRSSMFSRLFWSS